MAVDITKLSFLSSLNYMKRNTTEVGSASITMPAFASSSTYVITHGLGYIPNYQLSCDLAGDGTIWNTTKVEQYTDTGIGGLFTTNAVIKSWATTTTLTIAITNTTAGAIAARTFYWVIYKDYNA